MQPDFHHGLLSVAFVIGVFGAGCGVTEGKQTAEALGEQYFASAARDDSSAVLTMYDDEFYKATPKDKWSNMYAAIRTKLGRPTQHTLESWKVTNMASTTGTGQYVTLVYAVVYERAKGVETLGVFISRGSTTGGLRGHNFNSEALLK
jgi:hypothetical protein